MPIACEMLRKKTNITMENMLIERLSVIRSLVGSTVFVGFTEFQYILFLFDYLLPADKLINDVFIHDNHE